MQVLLKKSLIKKWEALHFATHLQTTPFARLLSAQKLRGTEFRDQFLDFLPGS